jgi:hypothetical protein
MRFRTDAHRFSWLERSDRVDHFICGHDDTGVAQYIDVGSVVHRIVRVIRGRVSNHRDLVTKLHGITNCGFRAGVYYEPVTTSLWTPSFHCTLALAWGPPRCDPPRLDKSRRELATQSTP